LLHVEYTPDLIVTLPATCSLLLFGDGFLNNREAGTAFAFLDLDAESLPDGL
jgi:hypothetical protein